MPRTHPQVEFAFCDPTTAEQAVVTLYEGSSKSYSSITDITKSFLPFNSMATFEQDRWLLDGSFKLVPSDVTGIHAGATSAIASDSSGHLVASGAPYGLQINWSSPQSVTGITLVFDDFSQEWCSTIEVDFYNGVGGHLAGGAYYPDAPLFYIPITVTNFSEMIITFSYTNKPYRVVRLRSITFGELVRFTGAEIKECSIVEQIDPLCVTLPISSLDLTLHSDDDDFSIVDPA